MSNEPDYKIEDLGSTVRAWIRKIYELLRRPISNAETSLNAGEVGDKNLAQIRAEVNAKIDEHVSAVYPHQPTLSDLFYTSSLRPRNFTDPLTINWSLSVMTVEDFTIQILGKEYLIKGWSGPMLAGTNYLVIKGTKDPATRTFELILSNRPLNGFLEYTVIILYRSPNSIVTVPIYGMD